MNVQLGSFVQNYKFTDKELDTESGLQDFGPRFLNNQIGRFIQIDPLSLKLSPDNLYNALYKQYSKDPAFIRLMLEFKGRKNKLSDNDLKDLSVYYYLGNPQHLNNYSYVVNNPLTYTDPTGESETAEKLFNYFSGRGWNTDAQLTNLSKIPTTISAPESANKNNGVEVISTPENVPTGETLSAGRPIPPSLNQRVSVSNSIRNISDSIDAIGQAAEAPGAGANVTLTGATAALIIGGPGASAAVIKAYPVIELIVRATPSVTSLFSSGFKSISSWIIK